MWPVNKIGTPPTAQPPQAPKGNNPPGDSDGSSHQSAGELLAVPPNEMHCWEACRRCPSYLPGFPESAMFLNLLELVQVGQVLRTTGCGLREDQIFETEKVGRLVTEVRFNPPRPKSVKLGATEETRQ